MYNIRAPALMAPLVQYRAPGRLASLLVGLGAQHKGALPNGALQLYKGTYCTVGVGGFWVARRAPGLMVSMYNYRAPTTTAVQEVHG
jgi:hypothetical protein